MLASAAGLPDIGTGDPADDCEPGTELGPIVEIAFGVIPVDAKAGPDCAGRPIGTGDDDMAGAEATGAGAAAPPIEPPCGPFVAWKPICGIEPPPEPRPSPPRPPRPCPIAPGRFPSPPRLLPNIP